jgi:broad specificity phosphatase PhoE
VTEPAGARARGRDGEQLAGASILLARHGQTDDNTRPARVQGWRDPPLNEHGRRQAAELARAVADAGVASLYSSHLRRARETAGIVGDALGLAPRVDERFAESRRGAWEGRLIADIEREDPELWQAWLRAGRDFRFPDGPDGPGESLAEHSERVAAAIDDVRAGSLPALVVCHGGTIRCAVALEHPRGLAAFHELEVPNAALISIGRR